MITWLFSDATSKPGKETTLLVRCWLHPVGDTSGGEAVAAVVLHRRSDRSTERMLFFN